MSASTGGTPRLGLHRSRSSAGRDGTAPQPPRRARVRLAAGASAVALAVALALVPLPGARLEAGFLVGLGAIGVALTAVSAWRFPGVTPVAVATLVAEYGLSLYHRGGVFDGRAPLFAAGYLLLAELAGWAREANPLVRDEVPVLAGYLALLGATTALATALGALVLAAAALPLTGAVARLALGLLAAVTAIAIAAALAAWHAARAASQANDNGRTDQG